MRDGLIWWSTAKATFGLVVSDGVVVEAAPYARRWAQGRPADEVLEKARRSRGVSVEWIPRQ
ncbi:hypothetical protein FDA94_20140 [Herbidospora galbida]|uniref:Uncharacterized protein n=1 Tax=Herbidospora galbida TaxID=2575442 RepID=A0A4U3MEH1_9ACTN|nr:hypothetical protein [Herbidospora galbida]TKK86772.1 hypothetical protein FDA94_20140 [Herbidospora galbida]